MGEAQGRVKSGYFQHGNVRIIISEHFSDDGKTMESLMEKLILHEARQLEKQRAS